MVDFKQTQRNQSKKIEERKLAFMEKAKNVHGEKYDYSLTNYIRNKEHVTITCNRCSNSFEQLPIVHLNGYGCFICIKQEKFIENAKKLHGVKYDYSKVNYTSSLGKVTITCNQCFNDFEQRAISHLQGYQGCKVCLNSNFRERKAR